MEEERTPEMLQGLLAHVKNVWQNPKQSSILCIRDGA